MSPIFLQPQLSPKHIIHFPQMPFCISHLHHSFLPLYLQPSWVFSVSYIHGLHTEIQFKILSIPSFHNYLLFLLLPLFFLSLSTIAYLIFQLQLGLCFFLCLISKFCFCTCGFREQVEKGFNGFSSIFCLLLYLSLKT